MLAVPPQPFAQTTKEVIVGGDIVGVKAVDEGGERHCSISDDYCLVGNNNTCSNVLGDLRS